MDFNVFVLLSLSRLKVSWTPVSMQHTAMKLVESHSLRQVLSGFPLSQSVGDTWDVFMCVLGRGSPRVNIGGFGRVPASATFLVRLHY